MAANTASTDNFDDLSHVFYLSNSDNPGIVLISNILIETNYNTWSQSMAIALSTQNKVDFIDGTISKPSKTSSAKYRQWNRCNNMVKAWLLNSLSKEISASVLFCDLAQDIWIDLKECFSQDELSSLQSNLFKGDVAPYQQYQCTRKFLMGLNDSYGAIRG
ncbi:uncharacterized protein LOC131155939 [Malania oleifera]|uniref:uncharacterized protein LOC131155939 n=1 Tax=Malania oleifera TaxID=397392 RepID=UPI0025AE70E1|nr:uncharacterized protein LOC131155939 [Malania oleifera]